MANPPLSSRNFAFVSKHTISGTSPAADDMIKYPRYFPSSYEVVRVSDIYPPTAAIYVEPLLSMPAVWQHTNSERAALGARKGRDAKVRRIIAATISSPNITRLIPPDEIVASVFQSHQRTFPYAALFARRGQRKKQLMAALYSDSQAQTGKAQTNPFTSYSTTVGEILEEIQRHLLEPVIDGGNSWQLWSRNEVWNYLRERCSRFLIDTGVMKDVVTFSAAAGVSDYDLDSTLAELHAVWLGGKALTAQDAWMLDNGRAGWEEEEGTPDSYVEDPLEPLQVQLVPIPLASAEGAYMFVKSTPLDPPSGSVVDSNNLFTLENFLLRLPAIFSWAVKYGVMADMLAKEGEANDPQRATYCEQRYDEGVELARLMVGTVGGGK